MLNESIMKWVLASYSGSEKIIAIEQLHGGMSSHIYSISLQVGDKIKDVVLRQVDDEEWLEEEPDLARHEAESLRWATSAGLMAPSIIAFDETGSNCGHPTVLMEKLEGSVILRPDNVDRWVNGLAESLVQIHKVDADDFHWSYFTYKDLHIVETQEWSKHPDLWNTAFKIANKPRPKVKDCFIHRDFHPANVLWSRNAVSGVVDWVNACRGPAGIDVGHCRTDLALLHGISVADAFLDAYIMHAGDSFQYNPYWDILSVIDILFGTPEVYPGWTALGVTELTDQMMEERLDAYLVSLLKRI
ncbi:phosphotransferase family protein [Bacillus sp. FSL K6-3431]|uniref:phosphotransferase family protein n=1 Tax=Bacillus sp. FSL K6-3431 TaxID=2921500 RepID=UPI0030F924B5